jgi:hypothetical protein
MKIIFKKHGPDGVSLLNLSVSDPPTQAEVNKLDELIQALRRV